MLGRALHNSKAQETERLTLEEGLQARKDELEARIGTDCEAEEKDASDESRDSDGTLASDILEVDSVVSDRRARNANDRRDGVIAVHNLIRGWSHLLARILKVLRQEGIEQRISHAYGRPAEPNKRS